MWSTSHQLAAELLELDEESFVDAINSAFVSPRSRRGLCTHSFMCIRRHVTSVLSKYGSQAVPLLTCSDSNKQLLWGFWFFIYVYISKYVGANIPVNAVLMFEDLPIPKLTIFTVPANGWGHHS